MTALKDYVIPFTLWLIVVFMLIFLFGCTAIKEELNKLEDVPELEIVKPKPSATPKNIVVLPYMTKEQSAILLEQITEQFPKLKSADRDMNARFCYNYYKLNDEQKIVVWAYLANAIIQYESGKDDGLIKKCVKYDESNGDQSIGFFQLSYGNKFCPMSKTEGDLCDPKVNIPCGVKLMGHFINKDGVITDGGYVASGAKEPRGLARYWSVVRVPDLKPRFVKGKKYFSEHHLMDIIEKTKKAPGCT